MPPKKVLIVEDNALIAFGYKAALEDEGYSVLGPVRNVADALHSIQTEEPDAVLLDVDLGGVESEPVAEALVKRGIPFLVLTGTLRSMVSGQHLLTAPMLSKPVPESLLLTTIAELDPPA